MLGTYKDGRQLYTGRSCCNTLAGPAATPRPQTIAMAIAARLTAVSKMTAGGKRACGPALAAFVIVPPTKVLERQSDRRCHICERDGHVYCFAACDPKS